MEKSEQKQGLKINRRSFLKAGTAAAAMGIIGAVKVPNQVANAASDTLYTPAAKGQWSKLRPEVNYGGAAVRFVENNDQWLGTTQIVGAVKNTSEADMGFNLAGRGLLGEKTRVGSLTIVAKHPFSASIAAGLTYVGPDVAVSGKPAVQKLEIPDPEQMSKHIKDCAYFLRADEVGIGKMPAYAYYSHRALVGRDKMLAPVETWTKPYTESLPYVIVVMIDQNLLTMLGSTGYDGISGSQSFLGYHQTANITVILAQYIRNLGYNARAHHARNYGAVMPPVVIAAGLGELSRTGDCSIHPRLGFRHKVAAVTTDLPLVPDQPIDFGLQDFCRVCGKCAEYCPSGAITVDKDYVEHNGYLRWNSDFKKCTIFRCTNEEGSSCGRCMKVCPWNSKENSWFHEAGIWIGSRGESNARLLKSIDDMFGYGTETIDKYKWWLEWPERYKIKY
ncbi:reductive dehalogenase [Dehalobacter sp. TBBPA1]|uniref:reductive dehalogenase n=1 Tax=Dehalobacter sp. TBBPA1 TaxID=3235037 RepID=UPI0034A234D4